VISLIGNRPALQIGRYQVIDYDTAWLDDALRRAARAADHEDFPFVEDIRSGIEKYLETKCPLKLLHLLLKCIPQPDSFGDIPDNTQKYALSVQIRPI